jgi:hypothetical protein
MAMNERQAAAAMAPSYMQGGFMRGVTNFLDRMAGAYWARNPLTQALPGAQGLEDFYMKSARRGGYDERPKVRNRIVTDSGLPDPLVGKQYMRDYPAGMSADAAQKYWAWKYPHLVPQLKRMVSPMEPGLEGELPYEETPYDNYGGYGAGYGGYQPYYPRYGGGGGGGGGYGGSYTPKERLPQAYTQQDWGAGVEQEQRGYGEAQQLTLWNI